MPSGAGGPGNSVDAGRVLAKLRQRSGWKPNVQYHHLVAVHPNGGYKPGVKLIPLQPQQRTVPDGVFIDDGGLFLVPQVKHPERAVPGHRSEHVEAAPGDVEYFLVVGHQLAVDGFLLHVPDRASGVDARGGHAVGVDLGPVKGSDGGVELAGLVAVEEGLELDAVVVDFPEPEVVAGGGKEVWIGGALRGEEHEVGGRVRVVEEEAVVGGEVGIFGVEVDELDLVAVVF